MLKYIVSPRVGDVDAMRHVNNTVLGEWFEGARNPIFKIFNPSLELTYKKWNLYVVHNNFNYYKPIYFGFDIEIRSYITHIGKTSFVVHHEAWQNGLLRADGDCNLLYFNYIKQKSEVITEDIRSQLSKYYIQKEELESNNKKEMKENSNYQENLDFIESSFR